MGLNGDEKADLSQGRVESHQAPLGAEDPPEICGSRDAFGSHGLLSLSVSSHRVTRELRVNEENEVTEGSAGTR